MRAWEEEAVRDGSSKRACHGTPPFTCHCDMRETFKQLQLSCTPTSNNPLHHHPPPDLVHHTI